ncbi:hypothetical protein SAMN04489842_3399 [Natronobacterium texcoconense]|uniref:Uncharacterized protein n=1 Tax=Natronobacterium texcoconense TaxID=1095778 RepID=A0A1H1ICI5_NATTX|nr:hypothetical protein SAMN04489842_3399 [Natronobacterium texcoconense]
MQTSERIYAAGTLNDEAVLRKEKPTTDATSQNMEKILIY